MKAYKNVIIEILELEEDIVRTSVGVEGTAGQYNGYDDTIGAFGL